MTISPTRRLLPLLPTTRHGSRSHLTCLYRCGNACDQPIPNPTDHPTFHQVAQQALARRSLLKIGAGAGALTLTCLATGGTLAAAAVAGGTAGSWQFTSVPPNNADQVTVPSGFRADVVISWGDAVERGAPEFDVDNQTPEAAAQQFGYNNDYVGVLPHPSKKKNGVLVTNHEYTDEQLMFPTGRYDSATIKKIAMASHGRPPSSTDASTSAPTSSWSDRLPATSGCRPAPTRPARP
jgi:secreted PhoX family phosphatase